MSGKLGRLLSVVRCVNGGRSIWKYELLFLLSSMVSHFCIPPSCCPCPDFLEKVFLCTAHFSENYKLTSCHHADNTPSLAHSKFKCRQPSTDESQVPTVHLQSSATPVPTDVFSLRLESRWLVAILTDCISYKSLSPSKVKNIINFHSSLLSMCLTGEGID